MRLLRTPFTHCHRQVPPAPSADDVAFYLGEHEIGLFLRGVREGHMFLAATGPSEWDREWVTVYE